MTMLDCRSKGITDTKACMHSLCSSGGIAIPVQLNSSRVATRASREATAVEADVHSKSATGAYATLVPKADAKQAHIAA